MYMNVTGRVQVYCIVIIIIIISFLNNIWTGVYFGTECWTDPETSADCLDLVWALRYLHRLCIFCPKSWDLLSQVHRKLKLFGDFFFMT